MRRRNRFPRLTVCAALVVLTVSGCATPTTPYWKTTTYGTWRYSQAEVARLPGISRRNILSSASEEEDQRVHVSVSARSLDGTWRVVRLAGPDEVYVAKAGGKEARINLAQITRIETTRQIKITPRRKTTGTVASNLGEAAPYVPLIPFALGTWPLLRATGLDAGKNAQDKGKAQLAYQGMSKSELIRYLGEPMEKYLCEDESRDNEVWIYRKNQVLRGGRALFIDSDSGKVYYTSYNTSFFKDSCSPLKPSP